MPVDVTMPRLSDTMEAGTVVRWHVKEGDEVTSGSVVADIETDKATMEMQVYDDGRISKILVNEGQSVPVGTKIAEIAVEEESTASRPAERPSQAASAPAGDRVVPAAPRIEPAAPAQGAVEAGSTSREEAAMPGASEVRSERPAHADQADSGGAMRISPVARRMAEELGVDLAQVRGSGPGGRIIKRDIEAAAEVRGARAVGDASDRAGHRRASDTPGVVGLGAPGAAPSGDRSTAAAARAAAGDLASPVVPVRGALTSVSQGVQSVEVALTPMRQTIARRLVESKTSIPHYQVSMTFAMDAIVALRGSLNEELAQTGVKLSLNDFIVRACALAMSKHPFMNASFGGDRIMVHQTVNIGVAVALDEERGGGLVVAVIRDADRKSLRQISAETKALSEKARTKGLSVEEMSDSTFTISNLGMFGVDHFTAIINPPNSAILACGAAVQRPVVRDGALAVGWEMTATLSLDHRVIDGAMAARFLQTLRHLIEHPTLLLV